MLTVFVQAALLILAVLCFGYAVKRALRQKKIDCLIFLLGGTLLVLAEYFSWIDGYWLSVIKFMGLNVIFAASLNLVNGYMGEFSCGHAGFMCVGAYVGGLLTILLFTKNKLLGAPLLPPELVWQGGLLGRRQGSGLDPAPRLRALLPERPEPRASLVLDTPEEVTALLSGQSRQTGLGGRWAALWWRDLPLGLVALKQGRAVAGFR